MGPSKYHDRAAIGPRGNPVYSAVMWNSGLGVLALLVTLGAAKGDIPSAPDDPAPRLRLTRLSGRVEVERGGKEGGASNGSLPYLPSGSIVRVRSGRAVFDCDCHATVRADEGDAFEFTVVRPEGGRPGSLRLAAVERSLEVGVGDHKFLLGKGSVLTVTAAWPGEAVVRGEGRGARHAAGSLAPDGSILTASRRLAPGDAVRAAVPRTKAFPDDALDLSRAKVTGTGERSFVVETAAPASESWRAREAEALRAIADWPVISQRAAEVILEKYGPPDLAIPERLSWYGNAPWKYTTVHREPFGRIDVLEQTIGYEVPQDKAPSLAKLDVGLRLSRDRRELSAASEAEETNFLALNLADEVVRERRTPEDARAFYLKTVLQWNAGKTSPYLKGLRFR